MPTCDQSIVSSADIIVSNIPLAHVFIVSAVALKSNVLKKLFIPVPIDTPKSFQSNVVPNECKLYSAVLSDAAMVFPVAPKSSGDISPLRNDASPLPKFLAPSYTLSQSILFIALVRVSPMCEPSLYNVSSWLS